jgi:lipopolysaccharide export system permease protein
MAILTRYIAANLVKSWLATLLLLSTVFGLISFISELDRTLRDYDIPAVALYTLMVLPQQMLNLAPVTMLLGSMVALAAMERNRELTIICCAGVPRWRLLAIVAAPTALMMLLLWLVMEYVTAPLHQYAEQQRITLRYQSAGHIPNGGLWLKTGTRYLHLGSMTAEGEPGNILLYEFSDEGVLMRGLKAASAQVDDKRHWLFRRVQEKRLTDDAIATLRLPELAVDNLLSRQELPVVALSHDSFRPSVLLRYGRYLAANQRPFEGVLSAFWQRVAIPLSVGAMVLLAVPISANPGARRSGQFGLNMAMGAFIGILFYLGSQILFSLGQITGLSLPVIAVLPALLVLACAAALFLRMRW